MAAHLHVRSSQGHPWARAHWRTSRCPFLAAYAHVVKHQGHSRARAHFRTARCLPPAEKAQSISADVSDVKGISRLESQSLTRIGEPLRMPGTILTRATLAAMSCMDVLSLIHI